MSRTTLSVVMIALALGSLGSAGCAQKKVSDRDIRREQLRINAAAKRQELAAVNGEYAGVLKHGEAAGQVVTLQLRSQEAPQAADGEVDAVPMPTLAGFLRFQDSLSFAIEKGDYDENRGELTVTATNSVHKSIVLSLVRGSDGSFSGAWTAPELSDSGTAELRRGAKESDFPKTNTRGVYKGVAERDDANTSYRVQLMLETRAVPPDALALVASARLYLGNEVTSDYLGYRFTNVDYKPFSGEITLKTANGDVTFTGVLANGELNGSWSTSTGGPMGALNLTRQP